MQKIHFRYTSFILKERSFASHKQIQFKMVPAELEEQAMPGATDSSFS